MSRLVVGSLGLLMVVWGAASSLAAEQEREPPLVEQPIYLQANDAYYELVLNTDVHADGISWYEAHRAAQARFHEKRRGRLAVVNSPEIHRLIREDLRPDKPAWFGLRVYCNFNEPVWINGKRLDRTAFMNWGAIWNVAGPTPTAIDRSTCPSDIKALPVHVWPVDLGMRWNANSPMAYFPYMLIEYPPEDKYWR